MAVDEKQVKHLAELSNFSITDAEVEAMKKDLSGILDYISELDSLDTDGIEPTYQVFEMENVWREDKILEQEAGREALLGLTVATENNQIKVPKVL